MMRSLDHPSQFARAPIAAAVGLVVSMIGSGAVPGSAETDGVPREAVDRRVALASAGQETSGLLNAAGSRSWRQRLPPQQPSGPDCSGAFRLFEKKSTIFSWRTNAARPRTPSKSSQSRGRRNFSQKPKPGASKRSASSRLSAGKASGCSRMPKSSVLSSSEGCPPFEARSTNCAPPRCGSSLKPRSGRPRIRRRGAGSNGWKRPSRRPKPSGRTWSKRPWSFEARSTNFAI